MTKKDFAKLCFNYSKEPNEDLFELWKDNLRCFDDDEIQKAISIITSTDKFFPTLNRFLEVIKDVVSKETFVKDETKYKNTEWHGKEIINEPIDKETEKTFTDFQNFIKEFRES